MKQFKLLSLLILIAAISVVLAWYFNQTPLRNIWTNSDDRYEYNDDGTGIVVSYKNRDDHVLAVVASQQVNPKANPDGWSTSAVTFDLRSSVLTRYSGGQGRPTSTFRVDGEF